MINAFLIAGALVASASGDDVAKTATAADREYYTSAAGAAGHDPGAQVRLALWCEAHGLSAERAKHLALAVLYDPSNALAHALQGLVSFGGKWSRPEADR